jgi:hypothetical protein
MIFQSSAAILRHMTTSLRARAGHRTLADRKLSDLTSIAAVSGLAATIGFGWLAAMTYSGATAKPAVTNDDLNAVSVPQNGTTRDPATTSGGSTTTRPRVGGGTSSSGSSGAVTRPTGRAHVSTGSS